MKKGYKIGLIVIAILIVVCVGVLLFGMLTKKNDKEQVQVKVLDTIEKYNYSINDRDSELYKNEFSDLKTILSSDVDVKKYSEKVARLFVIDLFSISTKINKYDVGGEEYYHSEKVSMFTTKVKSELYDLVEDDSYGDRNQELPLVSKIDTVSVEEVTYKLGDKEVDAYEVTLKWEYEKDLGYQNKAVVTVTKDGNKQSVVAFKLVEE